MAWTDLSAAFGYGSKLTSAQMQQLRDNITALANGDAGAPPILYTAISASNAGEVRLYTSTWHQWYEVLGWDGVWRQCCPDFGSPP